MTQTDRIWPAWRRRELIQLTGLSGFLLHTGCSAADLLDPGPPAGLGSQMAVALSPRRFHVLAVAAEGLFPGNGSAPAALSLQVPQKIDREVYFGGALFRSQVEQCLDVLEYGGVLAGWWGRFSRLAVERRIDAFNSLLAHRWLPMRQVGMAVSQLVKAFYYADERAWPAIGYDGPWLPAKEPESSLHYRLEVEYARERKST